MVNAFDILRDDLIAFAEVVYPGYQSSRHHIELARKLEAVERGEIKRLAVNMPPQRGKSLQTSVLFPAWCMGRNPDRRIILTGYTSEVGERYSRGARDIALSDRYRSIFDMRVDPSLQGVSLWRPQKGNGYVRAAGIGGAITSFGADLFIIDDPFKDMDEAVSEVMREKVWEWYQSVALTRLSPSAGLILVQTRWHVDDLTGRLLNEQKDQWEEVHFPAVYEDGSVLWPEKWSKEQYDQIKEEVGSRTWNALYQGKPVPDEGGLFKRSWFVKSGRAPDGLRWVRAWDLATSEKTSADFTAGALVAVDDLKQVWIKDVVRGQWEWPEARRRIMQTAHQDGPGVSVLVEHGAYKGGELVRDLQDNWERIDIAIRGVKPVGDKVQRANPWAARAESGRVLVVEGEWNRQFIDECASFPLGAHDDVVDAVSLAFSQLAKSPLIGSDYEKITKPNTHRWWEQYRKEYGKLQQDLNGENRVIYAGSRVFDE